MELKVKLEKFEGPLDLLLHLLEKNKVEIYDIPIVEITNQYMDYIHEMNRQDLNLMSEFMVMAATLLDIKSKMLLPKKEAAEEEEDPRAELVQQLLEYKLYKSISYKLKDRQEDAEKVMYKVPTIPKEVAAYEPPVDTQGLLEGLTLQKLHSVFEAMLKRQTDKIDPVRSKFGKIEKEEVSLEEKTAVLEQYASNHKKFSFRGLFKRQPSRVQVIVTFLAVLELMKTGKIEIIQEHAFEDIHITSKIAA